MIEDMGNVARGKYAPVMCAPMEIQCTWNCLPAWIIFSYVLVNPYSFYISFRRIKTGSIYVAYICHFFNDQASGVATFKCLRRCSCNHNNIWNNVHLFLVIAASWSGHLFLHALFYILQSLQWGFHVHKRHSAWVIRPSLCLLSLAACVVKRTLGGMVGNEVIDLVSIIVML